MLNPQTVTASRRLFVLFAATTLAPAIGLVWLGWRLVEQDRALESRHVQERREHAADLGAAALQRVLAEIEERLGRIVSAPPATLAAAIEKAETPRAGTAVVAFGRQGLLARGGIALPYYPAVPRAAAPPPALFARAESLEFKDRSPADAIRALQRLAGSDDPAWKGGALVRLARNYRKSGNLPAALAAFQELGKLGDVQVEGVPAGLLAVQGAGLVLEAWGREEELRRHAAGWWT